MLNQILRTLRLEMPTQNNPPLVLLFRDAHGLVSSKTITPKTVLSLYETLASRFCDAEVT